MKRIILRGGALLELDQVRHVLAVVKYRTFLEASFQLNRSQSSLSKSIRRLEEELGISIFERTTRRVELTVSASYDDPTALVKKAVFSAIEEDARILKEPAPFVSITAYGDSAISYIVRVWTSSANCWDVQFSLTEAIRASRT